MQRTILQLLIILTIIIAPYSSWAKSSPWDSIDESSTRLIISDYSDKKITSNSAQIATAKLGLHITLKKYWHTYWRTPGDGGLAMTLDYSKSRNLKSAELLYPAPTRFSTEFAGYAPIETFGYADEVIFPIILTPIDASKAMEINLKADYGVCDEICIFRTSQFNMSVEPEYFDSQNDILIRRFVEQTPQAINPLSVNIISTKLLKNNIIEVTADIQNDIFNQPDIFIEAGVDFSFPKPKVTISEAGKTAIFTTKFSTLLDGANITKTTPIITITNNNKSAEQIIKLTSSDTLTNNGNILLYIALALIGGLILNIMPCVLPVLSLKLLGVMKHGGGNKNIVRSSFLITTLGIITSFLGLAIIVIGLKAAGNTVGWGFHFQQPILLIAMVIILNLFAANQWSLFAINLPTWLGGSINKALDSQDIHTPAGNFLTGAFATLMATPCSAPFLGTAISFALSQGTQETLIIFFSMGVGLALPYILFAFAPRLITKLPKPGKWMIIVKHLLGALLLLTSVWLIWVLSHQLGFISAILVAALSVASLLLLLAYKNIAAFSLPLLISLIIIGLAITFYLPIKLSDTSKAKILEQGMWQRFDEQMIAKHVAQGKVVFVDITADWCITCKVNKWNVINNIEVMNALKSDYLIAMQGDISSPNEEIADYLARNNRYGIPFNRVYGPSAPQGILLSELLSKQAVLNAIKQAK